MNETKTEPTQPETKQPVMPAKAAAKPTNENKAKKLDTQPRVEASGKNTMPEPQGQSIATLPRPTLADFAAFLDKAPKEHLPTMMVRIANKCLAEKVFSTPGAMAEAIVGASKGVK